jgi:hypothetical protein
MGSGDFLSCLHPFASASQYSASASQCSASFLASVARSRDMISNCSKCSLGVMTVTNNFSSLIGSLSMPTYEVVMRRDTLVSLFLNVADFSDFIFDAGQPRSLKRNLVASEG